MTAPEGRAGEDGAEGDVAEGGVATAERADGPEAAPGSTPDSAERVGAAAETPPSETGSVRNRRLVLAAGAVVAVGALVAGLAFAGGSDPAPAPPPVASPATGEIPAPPVPGPRAVQIAPVDESTPVRLHVPAIVADSSLTQVGVDAQNAVEVPPLSQPMQAAWYKLGPTPGEVGPAIVLGHVNGNGRPGIFANLDKLRPGQEIAIDREDGQTATFTVRRAITARKDAFPTQEVYGDTPGAELRLITCGGELDRANHNYESNVIVFAQLTGIRRT